MRLGQGLENTHGLFLRTYLLPSRLDLRMWAQMSAINLAQDALVVGPFMSSPRWVREVTRDQIAAGHGHLVFKEVSRLEMAPRDIKSTKESSAKDPFPSLQMDKPRLT